MSLKEGYKKTSKIVFKAPVREKKSVVVNGIDLLENVPPRTENEVPGTGGDSPCGGRVLWVQLGTLPPCRALPVFPKPRTGVSQGLRASRSALTTGHLKGAALSSEILVFY